ncbi:MAG: hypothetical protein H0U44_12055 [Flavisolibacter sp.]|jgi:hypothetical protein|nr:hypothetical protein [Flavisolibacter sp.]
MHSILSRTLIFFLPVLFSCAGSKLGSAHTKEEMKMNISESPNVIDYGILKQQEVPNLAGRLEKGRGPMTGLIGGAVSFATDAVKQMIAKDEKKYTAEYQYALTGLYFYDQLSLDGPFDPIGMQFKGFRLIRMFDNDGKKDTAMVADFELDQTNPYEIINNSIFRLKLKDIRLNYAKAKVPNNNNFLNMDFEISFKTSYVNGQGDIYKNVELGKFYFFLRNAPLDKSTPEYTAYYEKQKGKVIDGQSFIIPRSFGYHMTGMNMTEPAYSQGAYNIEVKVKESSKNLFVNQLIIDNSGNFVDVLENQLKKKLK